MAQPSKRWVEEVKKAIPRTAKYLHGDPSVSVIEAATLLSRQHAKVVKKVKQRREAAGSMVAGDISERAYRTACNDLLAALQQGWKK